ncbi:capsid cement protein [Roseateles chitinivorans]|uniref:capsid cement protein n=1 Tax=Roseateles chitinivorans TaxID=2917965 RepID=UPI003D67BD1E
MKTQQVTLTTTIPCTVALTKRRFVSLAGAPTAAGAWSPGVAEVDCDPGLQAAVNASGIILVEAGAAIAAGAQVEADAQARAITLNAGAANGRALDAAAAAGDVIRILR